VIFIDECFGHFIIHIVRSLVMKENRNWSEEVLKKLFQEDRVLR
jgi:hypothetical protein